MAIRSATTTWSGGLQDGGGRVELTSSKLGAYDVSFPQRAADDAGGTTSPEELIAAAHSSCFAMQFSALLAAAGGTDIALTISADVSFGPDPAGGFRLPDSTLHVSGGATGVDPATFATVAEDAKNTCPVSKALTGVQITLDVTGG